MGKAAVRSALRRTTCSAVPSALVAAGCGSSQPARVNRYGWRTCENVKREMERRSSGSGVGKYGACGVGGECSVLISGGIKAKRSQTRSDVMGTMV
jgi:hypothetical protein